MNVRGETASVLMGLGVGLLLALLGIVGAVGAAGYLAVVLFLALLCAGALAFAGSSFLQRLFPVHAAMSAHGSTSPGSELGVMAPSMAALPAGIMAGPAYFLVLASALALTIDVGLLALAGSLASAVGLVVAYVGGVALFLIASGLRLGGAEYLALTGGAIVVAGGVIGVLGGLLFSSVVALGYLLIIASGYTAYRLDRSQAQRMALAPSTVRISLEAGVDEDALEWVDIFRGLSRGQRRLVAKLGHIIEVPSGDILGRQGSRGEALYAILEGQAELTTRSPMGQLTVRIAGPGESLPLAALLGDGNLITTAVAFGDLRALAIPQYQLLDLCRERPDIGMRLFQSIAEILGDRYRNTLNRLTQSMDRVLESSELWANV